MLTVCRGQLMRRMVSQTARAGLEMAPGTLKYIVMGSLLFNPCNQMSDAINWVCWFALLNHIPLATMTQKEVNQFIRGQLVRLRQFVR